jgi:hypothetical protein
LLVPWLRCSVCRRLNASDGANYRPPAPAVPIFVCSNTTRRYSFTVLVCGHHCGTLSTSGRTSQPVNGARHHDLPPAPYPRRQRIPAFSHPLPCPRPPSHRLPQATRHLDRASYLAYSPRLRAFESLSLPAHRLVDTGVGLRQVPPTFGGSLGALWVGVAGGEWVSVE